MVAEYSSRAERRKGRIGKVFPDKRPKFRRRNSGQVSVAPTLPQSSSPPSAKTSADLQTNRPIGPLGPNFTDKKSSSQVRESIRESRASAKSRNRRPASSGPTSKPPSSTDSGTNPSPTNPAQWLTKQHYASLMTALGTARASVGLVYDALRRQAGPGRREQFDTTFDTILTLLSEWDEAEAALRRYRSATRGRP